MPWKHPCLPFGLSTLVNRRLGRGGGKKGRFGRFGHWTLLGAGLDRVKGYGHYPYYPYMAASRRRTEDPKTLTASRFSDETRFAGFAEANRPTDPRSNLSVSRLRKTQKEGAWASPSPSLCCKLARALALALALALADRTLHLVIADSTSDAAATATVTATWRGRHLVINAPPSFRHCRFRTKRHMRP